MSESEFRKTLGDFQDRIIRMVDEDLSTPVHPLFHERGEALRKVNSRIFIPNVTPLVVNGIPRWSVSGGTWAKTAVYEQRILERFMQRIGGQPAFAEAVRVVYQVGRNIGRSPFVSECLLTLLGYEVLTEKLDKPSFGADRREELTSGFLEDLRAGTSAIKGMIGLGGLELEPLEVILREDSEQLVRFRRTSEDDIVKNFRAVPEIERFSDHHPPSLAANDALVVIEQDLGPWTESVHQLGWTDPLFYCSVRPFDWTAEAALVQIGRATNALGLFQSAAWPLYKFIRFEFYLKKTSAPPIYTLDIPVSEDRIVRPLDEERIHPYLRRNPGSP